MLDHRIAEHTMQSIAQELNLSETTFVQKTSDGQYSIRYFSPKTEVPLCGHATLAAAKVIFQDTTIQQILFKTNHGLDLKITQKSPYLQMQFPAYELAPMTAPTALLDALGIAEVLYSGYNKETNILMIEVANTGQLAALTPDFKALVKSHASLFAVSVTAQAQEDGYDFHSRLFWPWSGSDEDPVTGGTHTFLTPYWSKKLNKKKMKSFQSSARSGSMELDLIDDHTVIITSQAVIVFEGKLTI